MTDPVIEMLDELGLPATRQNYIDLNWSPLPDPWTPGDEAELPEELQDWTQFEVQDGELVAKGSATRDADPWANEPRKSKGPGGGEWTAGGGGGGAPAALVKTGGKNVQVHVHREPAPEPPISQNLIRLTGQDPARYQGIGDAEFTGPHAAVNAVRASRLLAGAKNRHAVEATLKQAGLKLVEATTVPPKIAQVFGLERYVEDDAPKSTLWYEDTPRMATGLAEAMTEIGKQGYAGLDREMKTNVNVVFAPLDQVGNANWIAAVWGDKATGQQWLVVNTANSVADDWSPGPKTPNTVGAEAAQELYDGLVKKTPPEEWASAGIVKTAEDLALKQAMIHEMGHVLDNATGKMMSFGLKAKIADLTGSELGIDKKANDWMRSAFSPYSATNPQEGAAEAFTMAVTRPRDFPTELTQWRKNTMASAMMGRPQ